MPTSEPSACPCSLKPVNAPGDPEES
jgi:hypothetical protein